uniref:EOG090X05H5 n=1 Tax=Daphnia dolichocephala TaxID=2282166 RepID=A0A4Y7M095_9CRUS|nr:EOG090X05H5 [Daphnia dolichocephala]
MRNQTTAAAASAANGRKRGRESAMSARSTRLKTGRHVRPLAAVELDMKMEDHTDDEMASLLHLQVEHDAMSLKKKKSKKSDEASVRLSDGGGSTDQDRATPPKKRKESPAQQQQQQQQQQVANGFPVSVFPPAADNNNSAAGGGFHPSQRANNNNKNGQRAIGANGKPEPKPAVIVNRPAAKEAPPFSSSSSSSASRRDGDQAAIVAVTSAAVSIRRQQMKDAFQPWVMQTYGDAAKTKTISRRKSERIARILRGEDRSNGADSSKFRFWVRAKGFRLGAAAAAGANPAADSSSTSSSQPMIFLAGDATPLDDLYVVTSTTKDEAGGEDRPVYKKVAVVEDFFDIIYREHVEFMSNSGGRPPTGKHAGQKRTYRAITEIYAFLPREAVTRFLMQCADCQRRGNGASSATNAILPSSAQLVPGGPVSTTPTPNGLLSNQSVSPGSPTPPASPHTPANVTATAPTAAAAAAVKTHQHHHLPPTPPQSSRHSSSHSWSQQHHHQLGLLGLGQAKSPSPSTLLMGLAVTTNNIDLSLPLTSTLLKRATLAGVSHQQLLGLDRAINPVAQQQYHSSSTSSSSSMSNGNDAMTTAYTTNDATSPITLDLSLSKTSTTDAAMCDNLSPTGTVKDDDDEDDDDVEDRIDTQQDPERLKAFNMFVRLFVDENLDRMVPISRQPREKIQAIIDSCLRQFPEFGERARKRIRTYLKSCRRHKRTRDHVDGVAGTPGMAGALLSPNRPMPSHLTSVVAEQILAQACENENQNAKRLRLGLEPISQPLPPPNANEALNASSSPTPSAHQLSETTSQSSQSITLPNSSATHVSSGQTTNLFRPAFGPYQRSSSNNNSQTSVAVPQGPTDLSTKSRTAAVVLGPASANGLPARSSPLQPHKLNAAEILAVRQLVTGYRESAAFLLRSADELEQLLHQQQLTL